MTRVASRTLRMAVARMARRAASAECGRIVGEWQPDRPGDVCEQVRRLVVGDDELASEAGETLGDEALGRVDGQDARLDVPELLDQHPLLPRVLQVMARVGLVRDRVQQRREAERQIGVEVHARPSAAVVPVVAGPRLIPDEGDPQVLAVRQPERRFAACPEPRDEPVDHVPCGVHGERPRVIHRPEPRVERAVAGQQRVQLGSRRMEHGIVAPDRRPREAAGHLLDVWQFMTGEHRSLRLQRLELQIQPGPPAIVRDRAREPVAKGGGVLGEAGG